MNGKFKRYYLHAYTDLPLSSCKILRDATPKSLVILDGELVGGLLMIRPFMLCYRAWTWYIDICMCLILSLMWLTDSFVGWNGYRRSTHSSFLCPLVLIIPFQAVLHQLATHTLPLSFFATHYGSLTDDFAYHPNIRNMYMSTIVDDEKRAVSQSRSSSSHFISKIPSDRFLIQISRGCRYRLLWHPRSQPRRSTHRSR